MTNKPQGRVLIIAADFGMARLIERIYLDKLYQKYPAEMIDQYKLRPRFSYVVAGGVERLAGLVGDADLLVIFEGNWWRSFSTPQVAEVQHRIGHMQLQCPEMQVQHLRNRREEDVEVR